MQDEWHLVLGHLRVYLVGPGQDASFEIVEIVKTLGLQVLYYAAATGTTAAVDHHRFILCYLVYVIRDRIHRDEYATYLADLSLMWLAYIYQLKVFASIHHGFQF